MGLAPLAVTSAALLRRERRAFADAVTQAGSVIIGLVVGVAAVWIWREPVLLVVSPIVAVSALLLGTLLLRRERYAWASPDRRGPSAGRTRRSCSRTSSSSRSAPSRSGW